MAQVFVVKTKDRVEGTRQVLAMLAPQIVAKLKSAKRPLIHPNLVHDTNELASVKADVAAAVIEWMRTFTKQKIIVGDASYHDTKQAFQNFGYTRLTKQYPNIKLVDLNDDQSLPVPFYNPDGTDEMAPFCKTVANADFRLTLVKAKCHAYYILTAAMKTSAYGSVVGTPIVYPRGEGTAYSRSHWYHKDYHAGHRSMARLYGMYPADAVVVDGTIAMQGNGPSQGTPIELGWVLGSTDAVAADAVAAWLMGIEPHQVGYLVYAQKQGAGVADLDKIEVMGPNDWRALRKIVEKPPNFKELLRWREPTFPTTPPEL